MNLNKKNERGQKFPQATRVDHPYEDKSIIQAGVHRHVKKSIESMSFVEKLYDILSDPEYAHIICWMPHGRSWKILNNDLLAREVCPKYFNHSKFASFNRQVNGWGFKRLKREGPDHRSYYDQCFLRGRPDLIHMMCRVTLNSGRRLQDIANEPNFYSSKLNSLPDGPNLSAKISAAGSRDFDRSGPPIQDYDPPRERPVGPPPASQHTNPIKHPTAPAPAAFAAVAAPNLMPSQAFAFGPFPNQSSFPSGPLPLNFAPPMVYPPFPPQPFQMMPYWQGCPPPFQYHPAMNGFMHHPSMAMQMNYQFHGASFNQNYHPSLHPNAMVPMPMKSEVSESRNSMNNDANNITTTGARSQPE